MSGFRLNISVVNEVEEPDPGEGGDHRLARRVSHPDRTTPAARQPMQQRTSPVIRPTRAVWTMLHQMSVVGRVGEEVAEVGR
jgi:hypothetical protein